MRYCTSITLDIHYKHLLFNQPSLFSVYCAGDFTDSLNSPSDMIALKLDNNWTIDTTLLSERWERVTFSTHIFMAQGALGQFVSVPSRSKMYFQGGYDSEDNIIDPFQEFTVENNGSTGWNTLTNFERESIPVGQIVPLNRSAVLDGVTYSTLLNYHNILPFGFSRLTTYDIDTGIWSEIDNESGKSNDNFIYGLDTFSVQGSNTMYALGGIEISRTNTSMEYPIQFNTISRVTFPSHVWETYPCTNAPLKRDFHTITVLPDNKTLLMYGGLYTDETSQGLTDIHQACYLLDLDTYAWRSCNLQLSADLNPARYHHSAVLVRNHLFILYGRISDFEAVNSILVFDVSDPNNIHYLPEYHYDLPTVEVPIASSSGLSTGAIVGIAVGCIALVAVVIGVLLYIRKRKANLKEDSIQSYPVDWNMIDQGLNNNNGTEGSTLNTKTVRYSLLSDAVKPVQIEK
ncbi:hypothetical protein BDB01DRAFT_840068 [Pilobolus umbonatus]|nr:hypothetical protein BDB01DRAFT_840068 [Pilobolus umbonatus]